MMTDEIPVEIETIARRWHEASDHGGDGAEFGSPICNCVSVARRIRELGLGGNQQINDDFSAELASQGLPGWASVSDLVRHHRGNATTVGVLEGLISHLETPTKDAEDIARRVVSLALSTFADEIDPTGRVFPQDVISSARVQERFAIAERLRRAARATAHDGVKDPDGARTL